MSKALRSCSFISNRANDQRRAISSGENLSHPWQLPPDPVRHERAVLVRNIVAHVIPLGIQYQLAERRLGRHAFGLLPGDQTVEPAEHHQERLPQTRQDSLEIET